MNTTNKITEYYHKQLANMNQTETLKLWIARDKDGALYGFQFEPFLRTTCEYFDLSNGWNFQMHASLFPSVTYENSPRQVELKLIEDVKNL